MRPPGCHAGFGLLVILLDHKTSFARCVCVLYSAFPALYIYIVHVVCAVLPCLVCLFDLACFFLSSFSSLIQNMYIYSTLQIQGIKRFACQTRLLQTQNAFKRCAKRVYYKRKTRVNAEQNACKRRAKRV